ARPRDDARSTQRGRLVGRAFGRASGSSARWNSSHAFRRKCIDGVGKPSWFVSPRPTSFLKALAPCPMVSPGQRTAGEAGYGARLDFRPVTAEDERPVVLVVDDEPAIRLLCRVNLEIGGYTVREAGTLGEAREQLAAGPIDVALLDVHIGTERS